MSDEAFAAALEKAKAEGRDAVHVRAWLALPAACPSQSHITLDRFTETPGHIAAEDAPQRTVCWEADLTENRTFGAEYSYRETAVYADPLSFTPDAEQPDFYTGEEAPHIVFTPLPAGAGGSAHRGHHQPGGEGEAHLRLCHPERPVLLPAILFRP